MHSVNTIVTLALGTTSLLSTWIVTSKMKRGYDRFHEHEFRTYCITVNATIVSLHTQSGWKRDVREKSVLWGKLQRTLTWETYYLIVAEWTSPQTQATYTFHCLKWKDEHTTELAEGSTLAVLVDSRDPTSYK